jgi:hypothetical protein
LPCQCAVERHIEDKVDTFCGAFNHAVPRLIVEGPGVARAEVLCKAI